MEHGGVDKLSRREIDALVGSVIRDEDAGPTAVPAAATPRRHGPPSRRMPRVVGWIAGALCAMALVLAVEGHSATPAAYTYDEAGLPTHPTSFTDGEYRFMRTQPTDSSRPVGYNPCKYIDVEIDFVDATPTITADVERTLRMLHRVSGLHLRYVGASLRRRTDPPNGRVLVSFARSEHDSTMTDAIAGLGGSSSYTSGLAGQTLYYVGGAVTLNADTFNTETHDEQLAILAHEFGHVLGLAHAPGRELMNADAWPYQLRHFAHGDLTGLARLGQLPCR